MSAAKDLYDKHFGPQVPDNDRMTQLVNDEITMKRFKGPGSSEHREALRKSEAGRNVRAAARKMDPVAYKRQPII